MPLTLCKASVQQRLRIAGQILLYGSIGTASSAVVYFLQDQIRQVQRLRPLIESKKRFADALRKHGVSDAAIQRMRKSTLEDHIRELESRGLVRLELVDDPPKWTASPHQGQMYHVEYLQSPSRKKIAKKSRSERPDNQCSVPAQAQSWLINMLSHYWHHVARPFTTLLKRHIRRPQMRKHWVNRIERHTMWNNVLTRSAWQNSSYLPGLQHHNLISSNMLVSRVAFYSQEVAQPTTSLLPVIPEVGDNQQRPEVAGYELSQRSLQLLRHTQASNILSHDMRKPTIVLGEIVDLFARSHPSNPAYAAALSILCQCIRTESLPVVDIMSRLAEQEAFAQILALFNAIKHQSQHPAVASFVLQAMFVQRKVGTEASMTTNLQSVHNLLDNLSHKSLQETLDSLETKHPEFATFILSEVTGVRATLFNKFVYCWSEGSTRKDGNHSTVKSLRMTDEIFIGAMMKFSSLSSNDGLSRAFYTRLLESAVCESCFIAAIRVIQQSYKVLSRDKSSGVASLIQRAYLSIPKEEFLTNDIRVVLEYYEKCETSLVDIYLPDIMTRYMAQSTKSSLLRAKYLRQTCSLLSAVQANSFLHTLSLEDNTTLTAVVQEMKNAVSVDIANRQLTGHALLQQLSSQDHADIGQQGNQMTSTVVDWYEDDTASVFHRMKEDESTVLNGDSSAQTQSMWLASDKDLELLQQAVSNAVVPRIEQVPRKAISTKKSRTNLVRTRSPASNTTGLRIKTVSRKAVADPPRGSQWGTFDQYDVALIDNKSMELWDREMPFMHEQAKSGNAAACLARLRLLQQSDSIPDDADHKVQFCAVLYTFADILTPERWLDFAQECVHNFDLFFGTRTFDRIVVRIIGKTDASATIQLLHRLIALSASQTFDVGVRAGTISRAITALLDKDIEEQRVSEGAYIYRLFKKVCKVNERLVSRALTKRVMQVLDMANVEHAIVMQTYPSTFGQRWSKAHYDRYLAVRAQLRQDILQTVYQRCSKIDSLDGFHETDNYKLQDTNAIDDLNVAKMRAQAALETYSSHEAIEDFEHRLSSSNIIDMPLLQIAVSACLRSQDFEKAEDFCLKAESKGLYVASTQVMIVRHRLLQDISLKTSTIRTLVLAWYEKHATKHPQLAHAALRAAVVRLCGYHDLAEPSEQFERNDPRAVDLMLEIHESAWASQVPFGIREYTALLGAYFKSNDMRGVAWTVAIVLKQNLPISARFMHILTTQSNALLRILAQEKRHAAARKSNVFWRNIKSICHHRRLTQMAAVRRSQNAIMNVLLYDAPHPDVDEAIHVTATRVPSQLDTRLVGEDRQESLEQISKSKRIRAEALRKTQEASVRAWESIHIDHPEHPLTRDELDDSAAATLAVLETLGANDQKRGKQIYKDDSELLTASVDHSAITVPWTNLDTDMLDLLKERVNSERLHNTSQDEDWDLLEYVSEIKAEPKFRAVQRVDTALEQTIRNMHNRPGKHGIGEDIWKETMKEHGQLDWARAGSER